MHHHRVEAGELQQGDILGEGFAQRRVAHGVAAKFHHHGLVVIAQHVGQRLRQDFRLGDQISLGFYRQFGHGSPGQW